jgi:hypothetical protein
MGVPMLFLGYVFAEKEKFIGKHISTNYIQIKGKVLCNENHWLQFQRAGVAKVGLFGPTGD